MAGFLIAAVPVALAFGGTIPQLAALIMAFFGPRHFGVNYGFSTSPLMVASVCGPFIGGLIRAWSGDYLVALYVAAAITLLGVAPAVVLREKAHKRESVARGGLPFPRLPFFSEWLMGGRRSAAKASAPRKGAGSRRRNPITLCMESTR